MAEKRNVEIRLSANVDDFRRGMQAATEAVERLRTAAGDVADAAADANSDPGDGLESRAESTTDALDNEGAAASRTARLLQALGRVATRASDGFRRLSQYVERNEQHINTLSRGLGIAGAALLGLSTVAVKRFAEYEQQMSAVKAATMASVVEMRQLSGAAIEAGQSTVFSAKEAGQGIEELAKAGVSTADILRGGLKGALDLAAAGGLGVGEAAETAASAMTQFGLTGKDVSHIADLFAAGAGKAQGSVKDMGMALNQTGLVAAATGLTIEETTGGLAAFAAAGLTGSDAGTSMKTMLQRLTPQSKEAQKTFDELGISAYDANGQFVGLANFAGQLRTKMEHLTPEARNAAMAVMFGSDAVRAANLLYQNGQAGIQGWIEKVDDTGFAANVASTKLDNLAGDWEAFTGALETAFISSGSGGGSFMRDLVQQATFLVDRFNELPAKTQSALGTGVGVLGVTLLAAAGFGKLTVMISETRTALTALGLVNKTAGLTMGLIGVAITAASLAIGHWITNSAEANERTKELQSTIDETGKSFSQTGKELFSANLFGEFDTQQLETLSAGLQQYGLTIDDVSSALAAGGSRSREVLGLLKAASEEMLNTQSTTYQNGQVIQSTIELTKEQRAQGEAMRSLAKEYETQLGYSDEAIRKNELLKQSAEDIAEENTDWADATRQVQAQLSDTTSAIDDATAAWQENTNAMSDNTDEALDRHNATLDAIEAQKEIAKLAAETQKGWDPTTDIGLKNQRGVLEHVETIKKLRDTWIELGELGPENKALFDGMVTNLDNVLRNAGLSEQAIKEFRDEFGLDWPPPNTAPALSKADELAKRFVEAGRTVRDSFTGTDIVAELDINDDKFAAKFDAAWRTSADFTAVAIEAGLDVNDEGFREKMLTSRAAMAYAAAMRGEPILDLDDSVLRRVLADTKARLEYVSSEHYKGPKIDATELQRMQSTVSTLESKFGAIDETTIDITAEDNTKAGVDSALKNTSYERFKPKPIALKAVDETRTGVRAAVNSVNSTQQKKPIDIFAKNQAMDGARAAQTTVDGPRQTRAISLYSVDNTRPGAVAAHNTVNAPRQANPIGLFAQNLTHAGVSAAQGTVNTLRSPAAAVLNALNHASGPADAARRSILAFPVGQRTMRLVTETVNIFKKLFQADGGIYESFAAGGLREEHTAQIAPGGAMRVWAEPETGGEAYIPLSQAKRWRSENILSEVARRFGGEYVRNFADGGLVTATTPVYAPNHNFIDSLQRATIQQPQMQQITASLNDRDRSLLEQMNSGVSVHWSWDQRAVIRAIDDAKRGARL